MKQEKETLKVLNVMVAAIFVALFLVGLAAFVAHASDTTMSKPVCQYRTKVFVGYECLDACPDKAMKGYCFNWYESTCYKIKKDMQDSAWYAPCKK